MRSGPCQLGGLLAAIAVGAFDTPGLARPLLPAASSDDHLWFVVEHAEPTDRGIILYHHAREMDSAYYSRALPLTRVPEAMAAWGNQLWLVFAPQRQDLARRETFTIEVERNPAFGSYFHSPHDHLRVVESLEGLARLEGFVGTASGPVALLRPTPRAVGGSSRLLQLQGRRWEELALPDGFRPGRRCHLAAVGSDGQVLVILNEPAHGGQTAVYWREGAQDWTQSTAGLDLKLFRTAARVGANIALVMEEDDRLEVAYLRPQRLLRLPGVSISGARWIVLGLRDGLRLIEEGAGNELTMRLIDPLSGRAGPPQMMTSQPLMAGRVLHRPLLFAAAVTAVLVVLLFRPGHQAAPIELPEGMQVLSPAPRLVALSADLAVGAVVTMVLLRCTLSELVQSPFWTTDIAEAFPCLLMIGITVAHSAIGELVAARTLGKALVGAKIVARDGSRPSGGAVLLRNIFKALVLLIPVLAVFVFLNPHLQGPGDLVARTVVVRRAASSRKDR